MFYDEGIDFEHWSILRRFNFNFTLIYQIYILGKEMLTFLKKDLVDIWRIRNYEIKRFTFRQQYIRQFIQKRLDYFFISNQLQKTVKKKTNVLFAFSSNHSPSIFTLNRNQDVGRGMGLCKSNKSLALNSDFADKMKAHIANTQKCLDRENIRDD